MPRPANRAELANAGARLFLAPDWQPIGWTEIARWKWQARGLETTFAVGDGAPQQTTGLFATDYHMRDESAPRFSPLALPDIAIPQQASECVWQPIRSLDRTGANLTKRRV